MPTDPTCGDAPVTGALTVPLGDGISLLLVVSEKGYCFSSWLRYDGLPMPTVSDEHRALAFPTVAEAADFFRALLA